ncbi:hypothetical protein [Sphingomonas flavescens]|jgi:hypothetical protein|uniref:hypothetical protein n=1 Tax=Sphingomonas flavescens TaxID=3132797 RepID=UPI0028056104|nr:hypothetical protein [Sphingomonas limnosediminicola]
MPLPIIFLGLAAQAAAPVAQPAPARRWTRTFISPMGEPFRQKTRGDDMLAAWFQQADTNHDGRLTLAEMQQDAERFHALLDTNRDGEIDPDEVSHYETAIAPEVISGSSFGMMEGAGPEGYRRHKPKFLQSTSNNPQQGAGRFGLLDLPEPVVSADSNFNRGVSIAEFRQAASQRFLALDLDHRGYLTLAALEMIRPAPPPAPNKPNRNDLDESALPGGD